MSRLGEQVKKIRILKGITQKQLGKSVGVSEKFIDEVECGKKVLNDDLIKRISKELGQAINELEIYQDQNEERQEIKKDVKSTVIPAKQEVQKVWNDALDSVLKTIPVYEYDLTKLVGTRQLPVISNKVEGYAKDKVFYIQIQDNDMIGSRIMKGDVALAHSTHEVENNAVFLIEYNGRRIIRQIKRLEGDKVLLVCNKGTVSTEAVSSKTIKILAKLDKLEIKLL